MSDNAVLVGAHVTKSDEAYSVKDTELITLEEDIYMFMNNLHVHVVYLKQFLPRLIVIVVNALDILFYFGF